MHWRVRQIGLVAMVTPSQAAHGGPGAVHKGGPWLVPDTPPFRSPMGAHEAVVPGFLALADAGEFHHGVIFGVLLGDTPLQKTHLHGTFETYNSTSDGHFDL